MPILAHFFPDVSAGFRPAFSARTGFYQEPVAAVQLACAADAGWPGAGGPGPQVKLFSGEPPPAGADGAEIRACAVNDEEAYQIKDAISKLQSALVYCGYAPR
ncbi:hypothetical protein EIL81_03590 [Photorhabdus laumondii subsp. laumondii]|nr:hypothetical protein PluDJC_15945 [Photorhabdus laumondii subsp. laumondii]AXG48134.1 hypothetical protein PluTT01m_16055 [Photorhabdus laumondii subsp. laumondii]MCZ1248187.1 hypothetical protein [Photorhabdus laumondii subsp. laumondii]